MAAVNPAGGQAYWFNGLPIGGIKRAGADTGTLQFWFSGLPVQFLYPASAGGNIKAFNGLVVASVKTINGLALSSVKTFNGVQI